MIIKNLKIQSFRNIPWAEFELSPRFNIFYGHNGSGKTSVLEAIFYLGMAKSFRSSNAYRVINKDSESCAVMASLQTENRLIPLGIERRREGPRILRKDGESVASIFSLASELPLQLISADSHMLFTEGPKLRRQFFDWGLFHVEPSFYPLWQQLQRVLKQRNAALKAKLAAREVKNWDFELVKLAQDIDELRKEHLQLLCPAALALFQVLVPELELEISYERGWPQGEDLLDLLSQNFYRDLHLGYTQLGPQRADLIFSTHNSPIQEHLSQGQLKLAAYALHLAQGKMLREVAQKTPIYLIDDIPSELDPQKRLLVIEVLTQLQSQSFLTSIKLEDLNEIATLSSSKLFHVKQGEIEATPLSLAPN